MQTLAHRFLLCVLACLAAWPAAGAPADSPFQARTRLDYYLGNEAVSVLVVLPAKRNAPRNPHVRRTLVLRGAGGKSLASAPAPAPGLPCLLPVPANAGATPLTVVLRAGERDVASVPVTITRLPRQANAVQVDRLTGGLIAEGMPLLPVGFYTYFPVPDALIDREVVNGFTHLSAYQEGMSGSGSGVDKDEEGRLRAVRAYMDRCAAVGMRVHYQLINKARQPDTPEKWAAIRREVEMFRDHPALLAWYLSDEPDGQQIPPATLEKTYRFVKNLDPYHPISTVLNNPEAVTLYENSADLILVDPYPIPDDPVVSVGEKVDLLTARCRYRRPVWCVPQAFGGLETGREPTAPEERVMTYLALIHGATGLQYFVRSAAPNGFPKAPALWSECSRLAFETAEIAPLLLTAPGTRPEVIASDPAVQAAAWRDAKGRFLILAANTENRPLRAVRLTLRGIPFTGAARAPFENRDAAVRDGVIEEPMAAFGTAAYLLPAPGASASPARTAPGNIVRDPGFEEEATAGVPSRFYATPTAGATFAVDSRTAFSGDHSLRLTAPPGGSVRLDGYPGALAPGHPYRVLLKAKALHSGTRLAVRMGSGVPPPFTLTDTWQEYGFAFAAPLEGGSAGPRLEMEGPGTLWMDDLECFPDPWIQAANHLFLDRLTVTARTTFPGATLRYTTDGSDPGPASPSVPASGAIPLRETARLQVMAFGPEGKPLSAGAASATFTRATPAPASAAPTPLRPGLNWAYFEDKRPGDPPPSWGALPDFSRMTPDAMGTAPDFTLTMRRRPLRFGVRFTGYVRVPRDGVYTFYTTSDDGSQLRIGETLVVNNDGLHGMEERGGEITLKAGPHPLTVLYFNGLSGFGLNVSWAGPGIPSKQRLPASALFHR